MRKNSISLYDWCNENGKEYFLKEWDYEKNIVTPKEVSRASHKKVYWICNKCKSSYIMSIQQRTLNGLGGNCQKCNYATSHEQVRKKWILERGSLAETNPELLSKWDYSKNTITPYEVSRNSTIEVWWKCPVCGYEFKGKVISVKMADGCKRCKGNKYVENGRDFFDLLHP